jgi:lipopolysaccharide biosynthesis regulator YciM
VAKSAAQAGDRKKAQALFKKAIDLNENCVDAWLHFGDFLINENRIPEALDAWEKAFLINPEFTSQIIIRFAKLPEPERESAVDNFFQRHLENHGQSKEFNLAYIEWQIKSGRLKEAKLRLRQQLAQSSGDKKIFSLARQLIQSSATGSECENHDLIKALFTSDFRFEKNYHCQKCGYRLDQMVWRCPRCSTWDSVTLR